MHAIFFGLKRAYQAPLRTFNRLIRGSELTMARTDLLWRIRGPWPAYQRDLHTALGVRASTVCRMLQALEKKGFVRRWRSDYDRRRVRVELTELGRRCLELALGYRAGVKVAMEYGIALEGRKDWRIRVDVLDVVYTATLQIRQVFRDTGNIGLTWRATW